MNANEEMLAGYADPDASYPESDLDEYESSTGVTYICAIKLSILIIPILIKYKNYLHLSSKELSFVCSVVLSQ